MNETAVDASLKGVGAAHALDDAVANEFAGVFDFVYTGGEIDGDGEAGDGAVEFEFESGGLMPDAPSDFALVADDSFDWRSHGEKDVVIADEILGEDGVDGIAGFGCIGGDRSGEANP